MKHSMLLKTLAMMMIFLQGSNTQCGYLRYNNINDQADFKGNTISQGEQFALTDFSPGTCFSLSFWFKPEGDYINGQEYEIASTGTFRVYLVENLGQLKIVTKKIQGGSILDQFDIVTEQWYSYTLSSDSSDPKIRITYLGIRDFSRSDKVDLSALNINDQGYLQVGKSNPRNFKGKISGFVMSSSCNVDQPEVYFSSVHRPYFKASYLLGDTPYDYLANIARQDGYPRMIIGGDFSSNNRPDIMPPAPGMSAQLYFLIKSNSFLRLPTQEFKLKTNDEEIVYWMNFRLFIHFNSLPSSGNIFVFLVFEDKSRLELGIKDNGDLLLIREGTEEVTGNVFKTFSISRDSLKGLIGFGPNTIYIKINGVEEIIQSNNFFNLKLGNELAQGSFDLGEYQVEIGTKGSSYGSEFRCGGFYIFEGGLDLGDCGDALSNDVVIEKYPDNVQGFSKANSGPYAIAIYTDDRFDDPPRGFEHILNSPALRKIPFNWNYIIFSNSCSENEFEDNSSGDNYCTFTPKLCHSSCVECFDNYENGCLSCDTANGRYLEYGKDYGRCMDCPAKFRIGDRCSPFECPSGCSQCSRDQNLEIVCSECEQGKCLNSQNRCGECLKDEDYSWRFIKVFNEQTKYEMITSHGPLTLTDDPNQSQIQEKDGIKDLTGLFTLDVQPENALGFKILNLTKKSQYGKIILELEVNSFLEELSLDSITIKLNSLDSLITASKHPTQQRSNKIRIKHIIVPPLYNEEEELQVSNPMLKPTVTSSSIYNNGIKIAGIIGYCLGIPIGFLAKSIQIIEFSSIITLFNIEFSDRTKKILESITGILETPLSNKPFREKKSDVILAKDAISKGSGIFRFKLDYYNIRRQMMEEMTYDLIVVLVREISLTTS